MRTNPAPLALLLLSACGGGGGDSAPVQVPANRPPTFTSAGTASVEENIALAYQATAIDPEGGVVTYGLSGGADAGLFTFSSDGRLTFRQAPSFETPIDADRNNVYLVTLTASDGATTAELPVAITVTNNREGIAVRQLSTAFDQPVAVVALPGSGNVLVGERDGRVWRLDTVTGERVLFSTVTSINDRGPFQPLTTTGPNGLINLAVRPNFVTRPTVFASYAEPSGFGSDTLLKVSGSRPAGEISFFDENLVYQTSVGARGVSLGGGLLAAGDGSFYLLSGDGGDGAAGSSAAQDPTDRRGKILRLTPGDPYGGATVRRYTHDATIVARGLQNPTGAFLSQDLLFFGDRGSVAFEELNVFRLFTLAPNFGWPFLEGSRVLRSDPPSTTRPPDLQYERGSGRMMGTGIVGGAVYMGPITGLRDTYIFADVSGAIWTVPASASRAPDSSALLSNSFERRSEDFAPDRGSLTAPVALTVTANGRVVIVDRSGAIYVAEPAA